jgi:PAS domain S-box-containing protein
MASGIGRFLKRLRRGRRGPEEFYRDDSFQSLVRKFQAIRYLVEQKATVDVIEKAPVGICITNKDHLYEYVNPAYCRLYGYEEEELIGRSFMIVVPEEMRTEMGSLHDQFMNREYELQGTWEVVTKDGSRRKILANAAYVVDESGRPKKVTFVLDITRRLQAQAELERMSTHLLEAAEELNRLAEECGEERMSDKLTRLAERISSFKPQKTGAGKEESGDVEQRK